MQMRRLGILIKESGDNSSEEQVFDVQVMRLFYHNEFSSLAWKPLEPVTKPCFTKGKTKGSMDTEKGFGNENARTVNRNLWTRRLARSKKQVLSHVKYETPSLPIASCP